MRRSVVGWTAAIVLCAPVLMFAVPAPVLAQVQMQVVPRDRIPPPRAGTGAIRGRVIDAATGNAIPRARVRLMGGTPRPSVTTDGDGIFAFDKLPSGSYMLAADRSTYMPGTLPERGRSLRASRDGRSVVVADGQTTDDLVIRLHKPGVIAGRVLDANGDIVDMAEVRVLRIGSGGRPQMRMSNSVNDLGEFRISRLEPGNYLVMVSPRRQFDEPPPVDEIPAQPLPTYYPSALALDQAQPIAVGRGQTVTGIDIVLAEGQPAVITGTVTRADGESLSGGGGAFISARSANRESSGMYESGGAGVRPDGTFRMQIPPGEYVLEARAAPGPNRTPETELVGNARVTAVSGSAHAVNIVLGRGATASGRIVFEGGDPPPIPAASGPLRVPMFSQDGFCRGGTAKVASDWSFTADGLAGTCTAPPGLPFGWTLKAVMYNGENWLDSTVTFEAGQRYPNVQIIVTRERAEVNFAVTDDKGQPTREYVALLFSTNREHWKSAGLARAFPYVPPSPPPGSPAATRMSPDAMRERLMTSRAGEFFVIAVDDIDQDQFQDAGVLEKLSRHAERVTVAFGQPAHVTLQRRPLAELIDR